MATSKKAKKNPNPIAKKTGTFKVYLDKGRSTSGKVVLVAASDRAAVAAATERLGDPTATARLSGGVVRLSGMRADRC
jgi:hypothetical protein